MGMPKPATTLSMRYGSSPRSTSRQAACRHRQEAGGWVGCDTLRLVLPGQEGEGEVAGAGHLPGLPHAGRLRAAWRPQPSHTPCRRPHLCVREEDAVDSKAGAIADHHRGLADGAAELQSVQDDLQVGGNDRQPAGARTGEDSRDAASRQPHSSSRAREAASTVAEHPLGQSGRQRASHQERVISQADSQQALPSLSLPPALLPAPCPPSSPAWRCGLCAQSPAGA